MKRTDDVHACVACNSTYSPDEMAARWAHYFDAPVRYADGVDRYCLACWLGVGTRDDDVLPRRFRPPEIGTTT